MKFLDFLVNFEEEVSKCEDLSKLDFNDCVIVIDILSDMDLEYIFKK